MPNINTKTKSKSKSRNSSRKSTMSSEGKPSVCVTSEDEYASIVMVRSSPTSRRTTPKSKRSSLSPSGSPRPEFLEPLSPKPLSPPAPPPTPWETLAMSESEFYAMRERMKARYRELDREIYLEAVLDELKSPRFWKDRIEHLEEEREYFNKKRGWSAIDIACVDRIDEQIQECVRELDSMEAAHE